MYQCDQLFWGERKWNCLVKKPKPKAKPKEFATAPRAH